MVSPLHLKVQAWIDEHGWEDTAEASIRRSLHFYARIYEDRRAVLSHRYTGIGTGYDWVETPEGWILEECLEGESPEAMSAHEYSFEALCQRMEENRAKRVAPDPAFDAWFEGYMAKLAARTPEEVQAQNQQVAQERAKRKAEERLRATQWYGWSEYCPARRALRFEGKLRPDHLTLFIEFLDAFEADVRTRGLLAFHSYPEPVEVVLGECKLLRERLI